MTDKHLAAPADLHENADTNSSSNPTFSSILEMRLSRRDLFRGTAGATALAVLGGASLASTPAQAGHGHGKPKLGFTPVPKNLDDLVTLPAGYSYSVLYRLGDPVMDGIPVYHNDGTDDAASFEYRAGDHHDGMSYFGMGRRGRQRENSSDHGLLCVNHEAITPAFLHPNGQTIVGGVRTDADEVLREFYVHGVGVIEVVKKKHKKNVTWQYQQNSMFNRRIHTLTEMELAGPAARTPYMITKYSTDGSNTRGTVNNCANGETPWGTYLTCEENWAGYFRRITATDNPNRTARELASFARYGVAGNGRELWATVTPDTVDDLYGRWNAMKLGISVDGSDDYRNVANTQVWNPRDADDGLAAGDKYLDDGKLYVATFNADGTGVWKELTFGLNNITPANPAYAFVDQADVVINARLAADAAGATKMDRPEWGAVDPRNGEVYFTLTNTNASSRPIAAVDAANPRFYNDKKTTGQDQKGNPNGHVIRFAETHRRVDATSFTWDVYLFGARATASPANVNLSGLTDANDFSSPDGAWFSCANPGLLWIQTDDGAYTDVTNCMMLAAAPGEVGDGSAKTITNVDGAASSTVTTYVGKEPGEKRLRRFLVDPKVRDVLINVFVARVAAHVPHERLAALDRPEHRAFVGETPERGALLRRRMWIERIDLHHPAEGVRDHGHRRDAGWQDAVRQHPASGREHATQLRHQRLRQLLAGRRPGAAALGDDRHYQRRWWRRRSLKKLRDIGRTKEPGSAGFFVLAMLHATYLVFILFHGYSSKLDVFIDKSCTTPGNSSVAFRSDE